VVRTRFRPAQTRFKRGLDPDRPQLVRTRKEIQYISEFFVYRLCQALDRVIAGGSCSTFSLVFSLGGMTEGKFRNSPDKDLHVRGSILIQIVLFVNVFQLVRTRKRTRYRPKGVQTPTLLFSGPDHISGIEYSDSLSHAFDMMYICLVILCICNADSPSNTVQPFLWRNLSYTVIHVVCMHMIGNF
jgi:hypothetical protein